MKRRYGPYQTKSGHYFWIDVERIDGRRTQRSIWVHREIMEQHLGRRLSAMEVVHHKNGDPGDNRLENLEIKTAAEHAHDHALERPASETITFTCSMCGSVVTKPARFVRHNRSVLRQELRRALVASALETMNDWKEGAIKRRDARHTHDDPREKPAPVPGTNGAARRGHKDRKRWCRGKVGVHHTPVCRDYAEAKNHDLSGWRSKLYTKWKILVCTRCGKELEHYYAWRSKKPPPEWVT